MNAFFEFLKSLYERAFLRGVLGIAQKQAAQGLAENLEVMQQAAKAAAETMDLADRLAAGNDPHKQRLAARIKDYANQGVEQCDGR